MAVIGSIRKQSTFLVIVIGVALAAFVLGDFAKSSRSAPSMIVGVVDGEDITIMDFNSESEQIIENTKRQQNKERLTPDEIFRLKNETWNQMVNDLLLDGEYQTLGLDVTRDELFELVQGSNPHPLIKQYFSDPQTGVYDRNLIVQYLQNLDNLPPDAKLQWVEFEQFIKKDRLRTKYGKLIEKGYYVPTQLAKMHFEEENDKASIEYVARRFTTISDSLINPTDEDYRKFYEEQKESLKQDAYRDIDYVVFDIEPSIKDMQNARKEINNIYEEFKHTVDIPRFVLVNSDVPYDSTWKTEGELPVQIDSTMFNSPVGIVVEPYLVGNTFYTSRLVDVAYRPDSMKANHILIAYRGAFNADNAVTRTKDEAKALADSLSSVVKRNRSKLIELAPSFSNDPSAQTNSGELDMFPDGMMVYDFNEAVVNNKVGSVVIAETPFGFHVIQVVEKKPDVKKVRVATVVRELIPSTETYQQTYAKASKLASENTTLEAFNNAVEDEGLNKKVAQKVRKMDNNIAGLNNPRQIIIWSFKEETEVASVSDVFDLEGQFVVAVVTQAGEEGYPPLEEVKTRLNTAVYNHLRGEIILKEMESYDSDMDKIAAQNDYVKDEMAALTFTSRNIKGFGTENEIIGNVFGMNTGETLGPVIGKGGVFIVKLNNLVNAQEKQSYLESINTLQQAWRTRIDQGYAYRALENASEIEDNRYLFY